MEFSPNNDLSPVTQWVNQQNLMDFIRNRYSLESFGSPLVPFCFYQEGKKRKDDDVFEIPQEHKFLCYKKKKKQNNKQTP